MGLHPISVTQNNLQELKEIWDHCFTFGKVDLVPATEEYMALLWCLKIQVDRAYSKAINVQTFLKKLMNITGMMHLDAKKRVDVFALSIYGLVVFPKALGQVDEVVTDLFDRLDKRVTPVPTILAETFRSLNVCQKVFSKNYSPLKGIVATPMRDDISKEKWMVILQNLQEEDIEWRAPWLLPDEILYRCGDFDWVPLLEIWGAIGYAPLLILRQYKSRQFVPATQGLADCEFSYKENSQSIEEHLRVVPFELEIIKQDFERRIAKLEKTIEQMEEEKMNLRLDVDVQKLEAEKLRKGKIRLKEI
ncbi:hypothetical protein Golax_002588 [Gossypium laxum]|uniref:DUF7745 domain-containing protein n=1 Tax=Gossypium laxum TaxID=34288 RepID=A0A7J9AS86_9ROSI|nr:hypothetical protein [Gossypium laxum]